MSERLSFTWQRPSSWIWWTSELLNYSTFLPIDCLLKFENIPLFQVAFSYSKLCCLLQLLLLDCWCCCCCNLILSCRILVTQIDHLVYQTSVRVKSKTKYIIMSDCFCRIAIVFYKMMFVYQSYLRVPDTWHGIYWALLSFKWVVRIQHIYLIFFFSFI